MTAPDGYLSGTSLGRYRVGPLLGRGGMGDVYRADDGELQRAVALKVLPEALVATRTGWRVHPGSARRLRAQPPAPRHDLRDRRTPARRRAGRIRALHRDGARGGRDAAGADRRARGDLKQTLDYWRQAADALAAAHARRHRPSRPQAREHDGRRRRLREGPRLRPGQAARRAGAVAATPRTADRSRPAPRPAWSWAPSATCRRSRHRAGPSIIGPTSSRSAASSTRPRPAYASVQRRLGRRHAASNHPRPAGGRSTIARRRPADLQRIVRKCLAKAPDERYQSMKEVALDLRELRRELDSGPAARRRGRVDPRAGDRRRSLAALATAAGVIGWWRGRDNQPALGADN